MKKTFLIIAIPILVFSLTACSIIPQVKPRPVTGSQGVFKSDDQGLNWQEKSTIQASENKISGLNIHQITFDIFDQNILYLATNHGLYFSENSADSWRAIFPNASINDFVLNPKTRGIIYLASGNQIHKTTNNGENWELIYTESRAKISIQSLGINFLDSSQIYTLTNDGVLIQSTDWGSSWQTLHNFQTVTIKLLLDPHSSQNLFVATTKGLFRSIDSGATWTEILKDQIKNFPAINQFKQLLFTSDKNNLIYLSKYGILKSQDLGDSWTPYTLITPVGSVDISAMNFNPENENEIYYIVDNILYHTVDAARNWKTKALPISGKVKASQLLIDGETLYLGLRQ